MKPVKVQNMTIGSGRPKICVPIVGKTREEILDIAGKAGRSCADMVEWRADWYEDVTDLEKVDEILTSLRGILKKKPLLFTFRTLSEGGQREISHEMYRRLNQSVCRQGIIDLVDVELSSGEANIRELLMTAHESHVFVIVSNHDFTKTPDKAEIVSRLMHMQTLGADIAKIAVMPQSKKDVLTLLEATEEMTSYHSDIPVITMSMGKAGSISRISGEIFGSAVTFGTVEKASAPGQLDVEKLYDILVSLHQNE